MQSDQLISYQPMTMARDPQLQRSIDAMAIPGVLLDHRLIATGDESALMPDEFRAYASSVIKVRRASGAARIVARELFQRLGSERRAVLKSASGVPIWPDGFVGSLAHDSHVAIAALAMRRDFSSLGVDVEPAKALDPDLVDVVTTASERRRIKDDPCGGRLLFSVKEAVYKAVYPLDGTFLDHHDVEVSLATGTAIVRNGRIVRFKYCIASHIVVVAFTSMPPVAT